MPNNEPTVIDIGDEVYCDFCNADYTHSEKSGGFMFGSYGTCPDCAPRIEANARKHNEQGRITSRCPKNMSFKQYILETVRKGDNRVIFAPVESGDDLSDFLGVRK